MKKGVRRGELAKTLGIPTPTVKYYTKQGLFCVKNKTRYGQFLYDTEETIRRFKRIRELKDKRLSIQEIRDRLKIEELIED